MDDHDHDQDVREEEPQREVYYLKNFIGFFEKRQIRIKSLYILDDRIVFLHCSYSTVSTDLWIYVTSEHDICADGVNIPKIKLIQQEEDYELPTGSLLIKDYMKQQLDLMQNNKIKLLNVGKKFIVYITRHNEVDFFELGDSTSDRGFYFLTEWKYFFDRSREIPSQLRRLEEQLIDFSYETLHNRESEVNKANKMIQQMVSSMPKGMENSRQLIERSRRCDRLIDQNMSSTTRTEENTQKLLGVSSQIRQDNLQKAFETFITTDMMTKLNKIF